MPKEKEDNLILPDGVVIQLPGWVDWEAGKPQTPQADRI